MMPRAPTQLFAVGDNPLSAIPCALNSFQSNPIPKYRFAYFLKYESYLSEGARCVAPRTGLPALASATSAAQSTVRDAGPTRVLN